MANVTYNQGKLIPSALRWITTITLSGLIIYCLIFLSETEAIIYSIGLSFIIPGIWSTYNLIEIDNLKASLTESIWLMGIKIVKNRFRIKNREVLIQSRDNRKMAFILLENGNSKVIASHKDEEGLSNKLKPLINKLDFSILIKS